MELFIYPVWAGISPKMNLINMFPIAGATDNKIFRHKSQISWQCQTEISNRWCISHYSLHKHCKCSVL